MPCDWEGGFVHEKGRFSWMRFGFCRFVHENGGFSWMGLGCRGLVIIGFFCFFISSKKQFAFFAIVRDNFAYYCCPVHRF